jgi:hypothetical protein
MNFSTILAGAWKNPHLRWPALALGLLILLPKLLHPWPIQPEVLAAIKDNCDTIRGFVVIYFGMAAAQSAPTPPPQGDLGSGGTGIQPSPKP